MMSVSSERTIHGRPGFGVALVVSLLILFATASQVPNSVSSTPASGAVHFSTSSAGSDATNAASLALTQVLTSSSPPPRYWGRTVYDPATNEVVMFGGSPVSQPGASLEDTWTYAGGVWNEVSDGSSNAPDLFNPAGASLAYDPVDREVLLVGTPESNVSQEQTWAFQAGTWTQLHPTTEPTARWYAAFAWDSKTEQGILYGGLSMVATGTSGEAWESDTWGFSGGGWTLIQSSGPIGSDQTEQELVFDSQDSTLILVATSSVTGDLATYTFDGSGWTMLEAGGPEPGLGEITDDPAIGGVLAIQADYSWANETTELYLLQGAQWVSEFVPGALPVISGESSLAYDSTDGYAMVSAPTFSLNVTGAANITQTWKISNTSVGAGPAVTLSISPGPVAVGSSLTITSSVSGGYGYLWHRLSTTMQSCGPVSANYTLTCNAPLVGTYTATISVVDQAGRTAASTVTFTVVEFPSIYVASGGAAVGGISVLVALLWRRLSPQTALGKV
jgi:hypothetical protein